jgi:DNA-binding NarL/FixJ family response regulator
MNDATACLKPANKVRKRDRQLFLAYDAAQAFQLMQKLGGAVALVDLDLKGTAGPAFLERLRENLPDLPVVVISSLLGAP